MGVSKLFRFCIKSCVVVRARCARQVYQRFYTQSYQARTAASLPLDQQESVRKVQMIWDHAVVVLLGPWASAHRGKWG